MRSVKTVASGKACISFASVTEAETKTQRQKARIRNEIISMVEKTKEKSAEKVHFIVGAIFVTQRIKRVVQP